MNKRIVWGVGTYKLVAHYWECWIFILIEGERERENIILFVCKYRFNFFQFNVKKKFKCTLSCIESFYIDRKDFCEVKTIIEHLR